MWMGRYVSMREGREGCMWSRLEQVVEGKLVTSVYYIYVRVIEFLRNFEFRNWHAMRGGLMLPDSISEETLEID